MSRRVFAVRYAHREAVASEHFYDPSPPDPHDAPMAMDYYVWAITADEAPPIVVDAGFRPETARRRGREKGLEALPHYTQTKTVITHVEEAP